MGPDVHLQLGDAPCLEKQRGVNCNPPPGGSLARFYENPNPQHASPFTLLLCALALASPLNAQFSCTVTALHPSGSSSSVAYATTATQQSGYVTTSGTDNAALWSSTAASFVNLNPSGATSSRTNFVADSFEAGHSFISGASHASLWQGTASSFVDLHSTINTALGGGFTASNIIGGYSDGTDVLPRR
ncbi:MAG: hypothetical protein HY736_23185 [Verrucomicrobia bacterium]|nr:hypothetical protein [Verrucomicrobiota bacterium]